MQSRLLLFGHWSLEFLSLGDSSFEAPFTELRTELKLVPRGKTCADDFWERDNADCKWADSIVLLLMVYRSDFMAPLLGLVVGRLFVMLYSMVSK